MAWWGIALQPIQIYLFITKYGLFYYLISLKIKERDLFNVAKVQITALTLISNWSLLCV